ncbi:MAG: IS200/IS605 family transposase [candidate division Zixibacteria bacterium]|nr:IS200/IS605 family transposase [Candidatus Tariuqbacter arcticus]
MPHSYTSIVVHYIFSTKNREKIIAPDLQKQLWLYLDEIASKNKMKALAIGGTEDHVHLLLSLPVSISVAKAVQLIKGSSSKWIHDTFIEHSNFQWQTGYGAFSISISHIERTIAYIHGQKEHHRRKTFMEECTLFLQKHGIDFNVGNS